MDSGQEPNLTIFDPETDLSYSLWVNKEDLARANEDEQFVNSLLVHAKATHAVTEHPLPTSPVEDSAETDELRELDSTLTEITNTKSNNNNYIWQYNQVLGLITSMSTHMDDLNHPKKRKQVFEHVANDLVSQKYEVNATIVQNKWNSLIKSYRKAKDNITRTGRSPARFNFFELMDDLLGSNPTNSCFHSINSGEASSSTLTDYIPASPSSVNSSADQSVTSKKSNNSMESNKREKLSDRKLKRDFMELQREEFIKRQKRHEERVALEREKIMVENRKLDLLERYLNLNPSNK